MVESDLFEKAKPIEIDVSYMGFTINSNLQLAGGGCGGCGSDSADSGCGGCSC